MNIGQAAEATGVSAKRIRYYEQVGLLEPAQRSDAGYRVYEDRDLHTLRFIQRARRLGFSLAQVSELLKLWHDQGRSSGQVKAVAMKHIDELHSKIDELQSMVDTLTHLANRCDGGARPDCPILSELQRSES
jgi:MerR family transcriptional regulator, copper efflux regulator